jgi:hypothetical protein
MECLVHVDLVLDCFCLSASISYINELDYENLVFILPLRLRLISTSFALWLNAPFKKKTFTCRYSELPSAVSGDTHGVGRHAVVGVPARPALLFNYK